MSGNHRFHLFLPLLLAVFCSCAAGCGQDQEQGAMRLAAPVRVAEIRQDSISRVLQAVGNVRPSASVDIVPRVTGEILEVKFREGQEVRAGQPLLQIDPRPYEAALKEKRGQLAKSEAQLAKAMEDRKRFARLVGPGYVSRDAYEQTATDAAALRATVQSDRAAVESAALDLSYCLVSAPIGGRIGALKLDRGNMIKSNSQGPIASINAISPCYVSFSVPESQLPAILEDLKSGPLPLTATPVGGAAETGHLTFVDNDVDENTGTIRLRATFDNMDRKLWSGQFVEVRLPLGKLDNALLVPSRAIQAGRDGSYVYVVDENEKADLRKVEVLFEVEGQSAISGNLRPGQRVVVEGQVRLNPGLPVKIMP